MVRDSWMSGTSYCDVIVRHLQKIPVRRKLVAQMGITSQQWLASLSVIAMNDPIVTCEIVINFLNNIFNNWLSRGSCSSISLLFRSFSCFDSFLLLSDPCSLFLSLSLFSCFLSCFSLPFVIFYLDSRSFFFSLFLCSCLFSRFPLSSFFFSLSFCSSFLFSFSLGSSLFFSLFLGSSFFFCSLFSSSFFLFPLFFCLQYNSFLLSLLSFLFFSLLFALFFLL